MTEFGGDGFLEALGWAIINSFWQVGLLWCLYMTMSFFVNLTAKQKYYLSVAAISISFASFIITFCLYYYKGFVPFALYIPQTVLPNNRFLSFILFISSALYLFALPLPAVKLILSYRFSQNLKRNGLQKAPIELRLFVKKLSQVLNIKRR